MDEADLAEAERCRGAANRLGFALQLCWLRRRGSFLDEVDLRALPAPVPAAVAAQLGLLVRGPSTKRRIKHAKATPGV